MRTCLLAPVLILLLALLPGCAAKQSAPSWPWKEGDEVRAELVSADWSMGYMNYILFTPDNKRIYMTMDDSNDCSEFGEDCSTHTLFSVMETENLMDVENLGLPMLITIKSLNWIDEDSYGLSYSITASRIRLDTNSKTQRYTHVLPNQKLTGVIVCNENTTNRTVYMVIGDKKIAVSPRQGEVLREFRYYCRQTGKVTIEGEFFFKSNEIDYFRTSTNLRDS